jgi:hypothetical protein
MRTRSRSAVLVLCLALTGCFRYYNTGDPQWDPPVLSKEGCPNIDGVYKDTGYSALGQGDGRTLTSFFWPHKSVPKGETLPVSEVRLLPYREDPERRELKEIEDKLLTTQWGYPLTKPELRPLKAALEKRRDELLEKLFSEWRKREPQIRQHGRARIARQGDTLEVTSFMATKPETPQSLKWVLDLNHPGAGCRDGAVIMRTWYLGSGVHWNCGSTTASEYELRKLPDGSLEMREDEKKWKASRWFCSMRGDPDLREHWVYLFPAGETPDKARGRSGCQGDECGASPSADAQAYPRRPKEELYGPFGHFPPAFIGKQWEKAGGETGPDRFDVDKALLECGEPSTMRTNFIYKEALGLENEDDVINYTFWVAGCMERAGFIRRDASGNAARTTSDYCRQPAYAHLPACQPGAVFPERSLGRRLNSWYCRNNIKSSWCKP